MQKKALKGTKLGMGKLYKHILQTDLRSIHFLAQIIFIMTIIITHRCSQGFRGCSSHEGSAHSPFSPRLPFQPPTPLSKSAVEVMDQTEDPTPEVHFPHHLLGETSHHSSSGKEAGFFRILPCQTEAAPLCSQGCRRLLQVVEGQGSKQQTTTSEAVNSSRVQGQAVRVQGQAASSILHSLLSSPEFFSELHYHKPALLRATASLEISPAH